MNEFSCLHGNARYGACDDASTVITSIGFCPHNPRDKIGVTSMVTPILHSFELVIAASSNFLMKSCSMGGVLFA